MLNACRIFCILSIILKGTTVLAWESKDTCQMTYMELMYNIGWYWSFSNWDFSTDKTGLYDTFSKILTDENWGPSTNAEGFGTTEVVLDLTADDPNTPQKGNIFGTNFYFTNVYFSGVTYFKAPMSGTYTFTIEEASDGAMLNVGTDNSYQCCKNFNVDSDQDPDRPSNYDMFEYALLIESDPQHSTPTLSAELKEGQDYSMILIFINSSGDAKLKVSVTFPDGTYHTDLNGFIGLPSITDCNNFHTTTRDYSDWENDYSTTYSTSIITHDMVTTTTLETAYYILTPSAAPTPKPSSSEGPVTTDEPSTTEISSSSEEPLPTEESSTLEESSTSEEPLPTEEPSSSEEPIITDGPSSSEEPQITEYPSSSEEPVITEYPSSSEDAISFEKKTGTETVTKVPGDSSTVEVIPSSEPEAEITSGSTHVSETSSSTIDIGDVTTADGTSPIINYRNATSSTISEETTVSDGPVDTDTGTTHKTITTTDANGIGGTQPTDDVTPTTVPDTDGPGAGNDNSSGENTTSANNSGDNSGSHESGDHTGNSSEQLGQVGSPDNGGNPEVTVTIDALPTNGDQNSGGTVISGSESSAGSNNAGNAADNADNIDNNGNPGNNADNSGNNGNLSGSTSNGAISNGDSREGTVEDDANANAESNGNMAVSQHSAAGGNTVGATGTAYGMDSMATYTAVHITTSLAPVASFYSTGAENNAAKFDISLVANLAILFMFALII